MCQQHCLSHSTSVLPSFSQNSAGNVNACKCDCPYCKGLRMDTEVTHTAACEDCEQLPLLDQPHSFNVDDRRSCTPVPFKNACLNPLHMYYVTYQTKGCLASSECPEAERHTPVPKHSQALRSDKMDWLRQPASCMKTEVFADPSV